MSFIPLLRKLSDNPLPGPHLRGCGAYENCEWESRNARMSVPAENVLKQTPQSRLRKNAEGKLNFSKLCPTKSEVDSVQRVAVCSMSWITVIWSMNAGACFTLAVFFGVVWRKQRENRAYLLFCCSAVVAAAISGICGILEAPFFLGVAYTAAVAAMAYELSSVTARATRLTEEVEITKKRFDVAADSADLGIWDWDLHKDEIWVPPTRRVRLGFPPSGKITFEHLISRWHADDRERVRHTLDHAIRNGEDYQTEFRVLRTDGSVGWVCVRGGVQMDHEGRPKRLTGISLDITARKEAEILARKQRSELEKFRQQKTALLEREVAERARLEREVIDSCVREQRRIAYDLHDGVGQQLVSIALSAKLLEEQLRPGQPHEAEKASAIVDLANEAARQARLTARSLEGAGGMGDLRTALEALAVNIGQNCRVKTVVKANAAALPISAPVAAQLYRITQEAVRNAVEHGAAHEVLIQLTVGDRDMLLTVQDDGQGFEAKANGHGMGLRIMRYRAQCIGGSCEVHSGPNKGTIVSCRVPLEVQPSPSMIS